MLLLLLLPLPEDPEEDVRFVAEILRVTLEGRTLPLDVDIFFGIGEFFGHFDLTIVAPDQPAAISLFE